MSAVDIAVARLKVEEGFRAKKYPDPRGFETIGYGFNVDAGISPYAAGALLTAQSVEAADALSKYWWWASLDDVRASVLVDLVINDGLAGLLHFPKMLAAIGAKDWTTAQAELMNSEAAAELPVRYAALGQILLSGVA